MKTAAVGRAEYVQSHEALISTTAVDKSVENFCGEMLDGWGQPWPNQARRTKRTARLVLFFGLCRTVRSNFPLTTVRRSRLFLGRWHHRKSSLAQSEGQITGRDLGDALVPMEFAPLLVGRSLARRAILRGISQPGWNLGTVDLP